MSAKNLLKTLLKIFAVSGLWWISLVFASASPPFVVVSIAPFHALVSAVMADVGEPVLLVQKGASPHHYNLRPSEIKSLQQANVIFWAGPDLESFLQKPLSSLDKKTLIVELDKTSNLKLLAPRKSPAFQIHTKEKEESSCCGHSHNSTKDMHFWLDPNNAKAMIALIVAKLSQIDPANQKHYRDNARKFLNKLDLVDLELKKELKPVQKVPFVVFHDAYQYFEKHYGLAGVGAIAIHPELPLSLQRLAAIRERIKQTKAVCVFKEPQFKSQVVENLGKELGIHIGELDPLGDSIGKDGSDYFKLLENIATSLKNCLSRASQNQSQAKKK